MEIRRRLLAYGARKIGYTAGKGFNRTSPPAIIDNPDLFITGFIEYVPTNGKIALNAKYADTLRDPDQHFVVLYDANREPISSSSYWDMTGNGYRSVSSTNSSLVQAIKYIRFCGVLADIDICYITDANTNTVLWEKGM